MTKEKQIEVLAQSLWANTLIYSDDLCKEVAEYIYTAGYRKISEIEMKIIADLINNIDELLKVYIEERAKECTIDTPLAEYLSGKIDAYSSVKFRLAELKTKYAESISK